MNKFRTWIAAAAGVVAIGATLGMGAAVMAQEGTPVPGTTSGVTLLDRVAAKLGINSVTLRDAVTSSATDEVDERVANGELTQERADALKQRIADAPDGFLLGGSGRGVGGHGPGFGFGDGELAELLGITAEELRTELQVDGATLATVAEAHGQTRDAVKAFLTTEMQGHLDEAVANGRLSQEEADAKLAEHTSNLDAILDGTAPFGGRGGRGHGGMFGGPPSGDEVPGVDMTPTS